MRTLRFPMLAIAALMLTFASCSEDTDDTTNNNNNNNNEPTLYERVGGEAMVADPNSTSGAMIEQGYLTLRSVVDSAIFVIAGDTSMHKYFGTLLGEVGNGDLSGFAALSANFTDFMAVATGSANASYSGLNMVDAHDPSTNPRMGQKSDNAAYTQFIGHVGVALGQNGVSDNDLINDLVALLETLRSDITQA